MTEEEPAFSVLWRGVGKKRWHEDRASSIEEASTLLREHDDGQHEVLLYENAVRFSHDKEEHEGSILFWWNENYQEEMSGAPLGRGAGWSEDVEDFVDYAFAQTPLALDDEDRRAHAAALSPNLGDDTDEGPRRSMPAQVQDKAFSNPAIRHRSERFAEVECAHCGLILPQNEAIAALLETRTSRTSGTRSFNVSTTSRTGHSSRGLSYSNSNHSSARATSGRSHYRVERAFFCTEQCRYEAQRATVSDKPALDQLAFFGAEFFKRLTRG